MNQFRSHRGTHPILDAWPNNCINCGAQIETHDLFACPNRELTPKEKRAYGLQARNVSKEENDNLDDVLKGVFK